MKGRVLRSFLLWRKRGARGAKSKGKNLPVLALFLSLFFLSLSWEELSYLLSQAPGQLALLFHRTPIEKVLKKKYLAPQVRAKLELVLDIKRYAEKEIGLVHNKSYTCLLYKSPSPRDLSTSRMPSSA